MGRELQKRKNRSSIAKVRRKPKQKKDISQRKAVAKYQSLGLTVKLNKSTGGNAKRPGNSAQQQVGLDLLSNHTSDPLLLVGQKKQLEITEAKIERDPESGKILRVIDNETGRRIGLDDQLNELDSDSEDSAQDLSLSDQHGSILPLHALQENRKLAALLGEGAHNPAPKYQRRQSEREQSFIEALVAKYGQDYAKMARDMKINYMQRSESDLKRRIKKWQQGGGQAR